MWIKEDSRFVKIGFCKYQNQPSQDWMVTYVYCVWSLAVEDNNMDNHLCVAAVLILTFLAVNIIGWEYTEIGMDTRHRVSLRNRWGGFNIKMLTYQYRNYHYKDETWEFVYWLDGVLILNRSEYYEHTKRVYSHKNTILRIKASE